MNYANHIKATPLPCPTAQAFYATAYPDLPSRDLGPLAEPHGVYVGGQLVSVAVIYPRPGSRFGLAGEDPVLAIWGAHTLPQYQRQGYGRLLLQHLIAVYPDLWLVVDEENTIARALYTSLGFIPQGTTISPGEIIMAQKSHTRSG